MRPRLVTPPSVQPVTLAEAKAHLRVEHGEEDGLISALVETVTARLDGRRGILGGFCLVTQTWQEEFDGFASWGLPLALAPVASIVTVAYVDAAGLPATLAPTAFRLTEGRNGCTRLDPALHTEFPATTAGHPVVVTYVCGVEPEDVPAALRTAILLQVGHLYTYREGGGSDALLSGPVEALLWPFKRVLVS